jgi:hemolysin activation/secretion protein
MVVGACLALVTAGRASAQARPEPAAIERTIPVLPQSASPLTIRTPVDSARSHLTGSGRFTLGAVNVDGATVFSRKDLTRFYEPYLASEVDGAELNEMAARITDQYRRTGYVLSYAVVPPQNVEAGMVRIAVVEGRIGSVSVSGAGAEQGAIESIAAPLLHDSPLKVSTLERALGLMRDLPGLSVTDVALLRTDAQAGIYALRITVKQDRVRGFVYSDNRGTDSVGRMRFYSSASISSAILQGDEFRVDLFGMPGRRFHYAYGQLFAGVPLGYSGARFSLAASKGDQYLKDERFYGDSTNITAQLTYPMLRSRNLTLMGKVSANDLRSVGDQDHDRRLRDHMRVARLGVEFSNEAKTRFQGELTFSRGLGFGGATRRGDPLASRADAGGKFAKWVFTLQLSRPVSQKVTVRTVASAQYSNGPLLSAEEFSLGGNRIGRAFAFNALTGDRGLGGGAELGYRLSAGKKNRPGIEMFGFLDGGSAIEAKSDSITANRKRSLASTGTGLRFNLAGTAFSIEAGIPIAAKRLDRSPHLFFSTYRAF